MRAEDRQAQRPSFKAPNPVSNLDLVWGFGCIINTGFTDPTVMLRYQAKLAFAWNGFAAFETIGQLQCLGCSGKPTVKKNRMISELLEVATHIRAYMRRSLAGDGRGEDFNTLATELFSLHRLNNPAYRKLCSSRRIQSLGNWKEIPAVPNSAFKELEVTSLSELERKHVFFSSGTTQQERSRHFHSDESLALYEESLTLWFGENVRTSPDTKWVFLTPDANAAPNSSLAHMFATIAERQKPANASFLGMADRDGWQLDASAAIELLQKYERDAQPVAILGTAFLFVYLLDEMERLGLTIRLPKNSWAMETGGYKGRSRIVPKEDLRHVMSERLGIATSQIYGEYGMSELSSQAYDRGDGVFRFPPWARALIVSPATGREAIEGERGLIRVYDLANVWSVMAVQTEDVGIKVGDGFQLCGRAAQAEARGCSLMSV